MVFVDEFFLGLIEGLYMLVFFGIVSVKSIFDWSML